MAIDCRAQAVNTVNPVFPHYRSSAIMESLICAALLPQRGPSLPKQLANGVALEDVPRRQNGRRCVMASGEQPIHFATATLGSERHICAFFHSPNEEYRVLLPFIREG